MAIVWLLLAAVSAISRNITRLALCLGYMLAHGLVVMYLRIKFSRFGTPTSPDGNDGTMVIPLERYVDFHARDAVGRGGSTSAQMPFSGGLDRARSPNVAPNGVALGVPAYGLPMLYAVVGTCPPDCTCPYCCLTAAAAAAAAAGGPADPIDSTTGAQQYSPAGERPEARSAHGLLGLDGGSLAPSDRVDELYLPGALLPESSAAADLERGPAPGQGPGSPSAQTTRTRLATDSGLLLAPLPPPLSPVSPSASPSGRPRSRASARVGMEASLGGGGGSDSSGGGFSEGAAAGAAASGMGMAVGVPVAPALLVVEGVPLADVLRRRRAAAGGGGGQGSQGGSPRAAPGEGPAAAQARSGEEVAADGSGPLAASRAVGEGEHQQRREQQQEQQQQRRQRQRGGGGDPAVAEMGGVGGSAVSAAAAAPQDRATSAAAAAGEGAPEGLSMEDVVGGAAVEAAAGSAAAETA